MTRGLTIGAFLVTAATLVVLAVLTPSCGSSSSGGAVGLAQGCSINSDCNSPLICAFSRCHEACAQDRDCPMGERCVTNGSDKVCELPSETMCSGASGSCPQGLTCAGDQCRNSCNTSLDCVPGQLCQGMACYDPTELADASTSDSPTESGARDSTAAETGGNDATSNETGGGDTGGGSDTGGGDVVTDAGPDCTPAAGDAGPLGFVPSNFDPNSPSYVDGGVPEGGLNWTSPPDVSCTNGNCTESMFQQAPAVISLPGPCPTGPQCFAYLYVVHDFGITSSGTLSLYASTSYLVYPVIVAATGVVDVQGTISLGAWNIGQYGGAGGNPIQSIGYWSTGPGGGGTGQGTLYPNSGAGGGSFCGVGGTGAGTAPLAPGGGTYGTASLIPLVGGSAGGYGAGAPGGYIGGSGGGLQISSAVSITVDANGSIWAGGGSYYGGGGSGGAVLLEAPIISVSGRITANGGPGASYGNPGEVAGGLSNQSDQPAVTPNCAWCGIGSAASTINGGNATQNDAGAVPGGGGGGAGWIRLNSACGNATIAHTAIISPYLTTSCATQGTLQY
jgi:hypothetical protein